MSQFTSMENSLEVMESTTQTNLIKEVMEQTICPICHDHMFIPFMTPCGHNFCYECLSSWLNENDTCPTCRSTVPDQPVLNIPLQNVMNSLYSAVSKLHESLDDITTEKSRREEHYKRDLSKDNLFNKIFKTSTVGIVDQDDGVTRCGHCHWEVTHGHVCPNCGSRLRLPRRDLYHDLEDMDTSFDDVIEAIDHINELNGVDSDEGSSDREFLDDRDFEELEVMEDGLSSVLGSSSDSSPVRNRGYRPSFLMESEESGLASDEDDDVVIAPWDGFHSDDSDGSSSGDLGVVRGRRVIQTSDSE